MNKAIAKKYFDLEFFELSSKQQLPIIEDELLRIEDEIDEMRLRRKDMELLYDEVHKGE